MWRLVASALFFAAPADLAKLQGEPGAPGAKGPAALFLTQATRDPTLSVASTGASSSLVVSGQADLTGDANAGVRLPIVVVRHQSVAATVSAECPASAAVLGGGCAVVPTNTLILSGCPSLNSDGSCLDDGDVSLDTGYTCLSSSASATLTVWAICLRSF